MLAYLPFAFSYKEWTELPLGWGLECMSKGRGGKGRGAIAEGLLDDHLIGRGQKNPETAVRIRQKKKQPWD